MDSVELAIAKSNFKLATQVKEQKRAELGDYEGPLEFIEALNAENPINPEETFLFISHFGEIFELNLVATIIWEQVKLEPDFNKVVDLLKEIFGAEKADLEADAIKFLYQLAERGFLVVN
jgi:hypothetical protein